MVQLDWTDKEMTLLDKSAQNLSLVQWKGAMLTGIALGPDIPGELDDEVREAILKRLNHGTMNKGLSVAKKQLDQLIELRKKRGAMK